VTRVVYGAFVALAAAFILSSVWQISSQVFGFAGASPPAARRVGAACAGALHKDVLAIDLALVDAEPVSMVGPEEAAGAYQHAKLRGWVDDTRLAESCAGEAAGPDAIAALFRYERAAEGAVRRSSTELGPVRREVESFIR
jgi:hypothetical protein